MQIVVKKLVFTFDSGALLVVNSNRMAIIDHVVWCYTVVNFQWCQILRVLDISKIDIDRTLIWAASAWKMRWPIVSRNFRSLIAPCLFRVGDFFAK